MKRTGILSVTCVTAALLLGACSSDDSSSTSTAASSGTVAQTTTQTQSATTSSPATTTASTTTATATTATAPATNAQCPAGAPSALSCTTLTVPVDPAKPDGPTAKLAVTLRRADPNRWTKPVLLLSNALPIANWTDPSFYGPTSFVGHDLVIIDVRGAGRSDGAVSCPSLANFAGSINSFNLSPAAATAMKECVAKTANGAVPLSTIVDHDIVAADIIAVRKSIGIDTWSVYASVGGADTMLHLLQLDPKAVTAVFTRDPNVVGAGTSPNSMAESFGRLATDCAASPKCAPAGDLEKHLGDLLTRLKTPVKTSATDTDGTAVVLDTLSMQLAMRAAMFDQNLVPVVPTFLSAPPVQESDDKLGNAFTHFAGDLTGVGPALSCQDLDYAMPGLKQTSDDHGGLFVGTTPKRWCDALGPQPQMKAFPKIASDIPVMVVLSSYESRSSETVAKTIFAGFPHTTIVTVPGNPSASLLKECFYATTTAFVDNPTSKVDTTCLTKPATTVFG